MEINIEQYGRMKGAAWFPFLYKRGILVVGQGGIGSWTSLLLSRVGCSLYLFDGDIYEEHNMTGQLVRRKDIGKRKSDATSLIIEEFSPDAETESYGMYTEDSPSNDIVICGLDNMEARKLAFYKWLHHLNTSGVPANKCFFQDGRLNAEHLQIFNIPGDNLALIEEYSKNYLFEDSEVEEQDCSFKQTSHCAAMIASHMVSFLTNWAYNSEKGPIRKVPFFYEYSVPLSMTLN